MRTRHSNHFLNLVATLLSVLILVVAIQNSGHPSVPSAYAGAGQNVSGFAWSQTVGWISFNCLDSSGASSPQQNTCGAPYPSPADYGVSVDPVTGNFSGFAWSSSIGYINFNPTPDGVACSASPCATLSAASVDGTRLAVGWVRACDVLVAADCTGFAMKPSSALGGWDGWIKLSDPNPIQPPGWTNPADRTYMGQSGTSYDSYTPRHNGVFYDPVDKKFKGFAWGSEVVGWVDFSPSTSVAVYSDLTPPGPPPVPILSVSPIQLDFGDTNINTTKSLSFKVSNTGDPGSFLKGAATVLDTTYFTCTAGCDYSVGGIPVGSPQLVTITFAPGAIPGNGHTTTIDLTGTNTAPPSSATKQVLGNGVLPISGSGLNFGNVVVGRSKDLILTITNNDSSDLVDNIVMPFAVYTCSPNCLVNIPAGSSQDVIIHFVPTAVQRYDGDAYLENKPSVTFSFLGAGVSGTIKVKDQ